jgi:hypothetical protein
MRGSSLMRPIALVALLALCILAAGCVHTDPNVLDAGKGGIMGKVVQTQDAEARKHGPPPPVPDANVLVYDEHMSFVAETKTDAVGNFTIRNLTPGDYFVRAGNENYDASATEAPNVYIFADKYTRVILEASPLH